MSDAETKTSAKNKTNATLNKASFGSHLPHHTLKTKRNFKLRCPVEKKINKCFLKTVVLNLWRATKIIS